MQRFVLFLFFAGVLSVPAMAESPGYHPRYVHALNDLRDAQTILSGYRYGDTKAQAWVAKEIRFAIREAERAAWDDGGKVYVFTPPDVSRMDNLLLQVRQLLLAARTDLGLEEDNPKAWNWRAEAMRHIDRALAYLDRALHYSGL